MDDATHDADVKPDDSPKKASGREPSRDDYQRLLAFRVRLRQHNAWQEQEVARYGLTFQQFQLLLCVKGHPGPQPPSVGDLAAYMVLQPNSTIELVNRCEAVGCARKIRDQLDARVVRVELTEMGDQGVSEMAVQILPRLVDLCRVLTDVAAPGTWIVKLDEGS